MADFNLDFVGPGARLALAAAKRAEDAAGSAGGAAAAIVQPLVDDAQASAGFALRSDAITFAPKMATGERTFVYGAGASTHAAVAGEIALGGAAATPGAQISDNGYYAKQASGTLWRVDDLESQKAKSSADNAAAQVGDLKSSPTQRIGRPVAPVTSATQIGANTTVRQDTAATRASTITEIGVWATGSANIKIRVLDSANAIVGTISTTVVAGLNTFNAAALSALPQVPVGGRVTIWGNNAFLAYRQAWTADGDGYSTYAGDYTTGGVAFTKNVNIRELQWYITLTAAAETAATASAFNALKVEADDSAAVTAGLKSNVTETAGLPSMPVAGGAALPGTAVFILGEPFVNGGPLLVDLEVVATGDIPICLYTQVAGAWTLAQQMIFTATVTGVQTVDTGMTAKAGQYLGFIPSGRVGYFAGVAMPSLGYYNFTPNTAGAGTDSTLSTASTLNIRGRATKSIATVTAPAFATLKAQVEAGGAGVPHAYSYDAGTGSAIYVQTENCTYMIVGLGQSLSMGTNPDTTVAITTAAEYPGYGLMVNSGVWPNGAAITSLVDLVEGPTSVGGETHAAGTVSAILSRLNVRHGRTPRLVYAIAGKGGTAYLGLKRGSDTYAELLRVVKAVNDIEVAAGRKLVVICTQLHHGEQDYRDGTTEAQYCRMLDWWQSNTQEDIRRITGQSAPVPMYAYQSNRGGRTVGIPSPPALAQLSIEKRNPLIRCLGPIYDSVAASDNAHVTGRSYRRMGRREGAMIADDLFATPTANSESLHVIASYWSATNKFCLQYNKPITIESGDTLVTVSTLGAGKGIDYTDNSGSVPTITGIAVTGTDTVEVTLSAAPTGLRKRCWIAARGQYPTGNTSGTGNVLGPRSGIRSTAVADTDPNDGAVIYHWACQEEIAL
ncbi:hypothetical protein [Novosphingobium resinovorum]|uniref:hypothetical protein n=1 Tax=Novosphingobium resinovorum TaxID=158500 RepID=UPI002ED0F24E|nr:hypothetical protein [Novosphingobium resinovorum]